VIGWLSGVVLPATPPGPRRHQRRRRRLRGPRLAADPRRRRRPRRAVHPVDLHPRARGQLALYGFATPAEKQLFLMLLGVPKVGPKHALSVLGGFPFAELRRAPAPARHDQLQKIPGIGKKTAEQILLSLGDKVAALAPDPELAVPAAPAGAPPTCRTTPRPCWSTSAGASRRSRRRSRGSSPPAGRRPAARSTTSCAGPSPSSWTADPRRRYDWPAVGFFLALIAILAGCAYLAFARFLAHRERMAALEAKRPLVTPAAPAGRPRPGRPPDRRDPRGLQAEGHRRRPRDPLTRLSPRS
jgi:hypothetical protein